MPTRIGLASSAFEERETRARAEIAERTALFMRLL
jgi:hypothetical protein